MFKIVCEPEAHKPSYIWYRPAGTSIEVYILPMRFALHVNILKIRRKPDLFFDNRIYNVVKKAGSQKTENNFFGFK